MRLQLQQKICAAVFATFVGIACFAQPTTPSSTPIKIIVPFTPGTGMDTIARTIQPRLAERTGQTVLVQNMPGASGNIGADFVAKSAPDGSTLLMGANTMLIASQLYKNTPFNPVKDFAPITQISKFPLVLEVRADSTIKTLQEFIDYAKANPTKVTFGSAGSGSPQHLGPELLKKVTGISMQHIPYKGAGPAANDLLGGQIFSMCDITAGSMKYIQAGLLRPLAVTTATRSPALPDVPTMDEAGVKGFDYFAWHGISAPAKTPVAIIDRFNKTLLEIFNDADFRKKWEAIGSEIVAGTPQQFADLINSEAIRLGALVKDLNIQLD